ncbi:hypothetical protein E2R48_07705 [Histophilus somni]|uniref:Phage tail collar domain-containing protein n=2 Tax=Histophilus somni TaxID=731 RepID=A0AAX2S349_HISSO|nr:hypothetical protein E2R48_07705 [Histophilus somni]
MPAMRDDGLGFEESPVIPDPTQDNHPVPLHLLKTAEQSVYAARDKVTELAQQVADNNATTEQNTRLAIQSNEQAQQAKTEASQSATQATEANRQAQQAKTKAENTERIATSSIKTVQQSAIQATQAENLAKKWASNPQNQIVQEDKYSAYHYALEAEKYAEKVKATAEGRKDWNFIDNVPISKDINDSSETKLASAFSVKTAYDKAVEAEKIANGKSNFKIEQGKDNADDYKTDGHYYFASGLNLPDSKNQKQDSEATSSAWHVEVVSGGQTTAVRQIARKANDTGVKTRFFNGSKWTEWKDIGGDGVPLGAIVAFPKEVKNPTGFLKCDGTTIDQRTYPDLYRTLGNKNTLPNLTRSDVGMTAYFATDEIPNGWVEFDKIRDEVTQEKYPELYQYLIKQYKDINHVPKAEDRFLRNAANELVVGRVQEDAIKTHYLNYGTNHNSSNYQYHVDNNDTIATGNNKTADNYKIRTNGAIFYSGAEETRPKSLVLKLCIKAKNTFDDVQFWIKAFGTVDNQGMMDASKIAVALQGKSDLEHLHTASQITDFNSAVASQFSYQKIGDVEVRRYPDGTMTQSGKVAFDYSSGTFLYKEVIFPVAFSDVPLILTSLVKPEIEKYNSRLDELNINVISTGITKTKFIINLIDDDSHDTDPQIKVDFMATGRWKEDK